MRKQLMKKLLSVLLIFCLMFSLGMVAYADDSSPADDCTLQSSMEYLVDHIGQRVYATPNESMAAEYAFNKFKEFGYTDVEWTKLPRNTAYVGRIAFDDGAGDIYGNALPNTTAFPTVEGKLVDLGTYPDLSVPAGVTGKIVGAVRFNGNPNMTNLSTALAALQEQNDVEIAGAVVANATTHTVASASGTPSVPVIATTNYFLNKALTRADDFASMERYARTEDNLVVATKPAPSGDPDLIIVYSSHMDSVLASPGASDNASGVAANIELAKRLYGVDVGNIEIRFAVVGAEEGGGMTGSVKVATDLNNAGLAPISIDLNMDMLCSPNPYGNSPLNAVSMDINPSPLQLNLPAYLVTDNAKDIPWADGIENVRIFRYGSSDHVQFANRGVEAGSMIIATDATDDIEPQDHQSRDNLLENYSYDRLLMCTNLMENAALKAVKQEVSKRAKFYVDEGDGTISLHNADQLFKTWDTVNCVIGGEAVTFTPENTVIDIPNDDYSNITGVKATGTGNADNRNEVRNEEYKNFTTVLSPMFVTLDNSIPSADVEKLSGNTNDLTVTVTEIYSDGSKRIITKTFSIKNNAAGAYEVGKYKVYVDTKGNTQIRSCYILT